MNNLSEEEKQAIANLEHIVKHWQSSTEDELATIEYNSIKEAINLIDKQQKKIENLKEELKIKSLVDLEEYSKKDLISVLGKEYISKDKIKAKIEKAKKIEWYSPKLVIEFFETLLEGE